MKFTYNILPRPASLGGGWRLYLLEDNVEMGGGVFPPAEGIEGTKEALKAAFEDAEAEAQAWLNSSKT